MNYFTIKSIPKICFAHVYNADSYDNLLPARTGRFEITYVAEGNLTLERNGETIHAKQHDIVLNLYTADTHVYATEHHRQHTVAFDADIEFCSDRSDGCLVVPDLSAFAEPGQSAAYLIDEIIRVFTTSSVPELRCAGLGLQLLAELNDVQRRRNMTITNGEATYVSKAKKYIAEHIHQPMEQRKIAKYLGITPEYLCSVFKKSEGIPVITYINRMKLDGVRTLMGKENMKLRKAAEAYGYSDPNYVGKLFKKIYGINIADFKKSGLFPL